MSVASKKSILSDLEQGYIVFQTSDLNSEAQKRTSVLSSYSFNQLVLIQGRFSKELAVGLNRISHQTSVYKLTFDLSA